MFGVRVRTFEREGLERSNRILSRTRGGVRGIGRLKTAHKNTVAQGTTSRAYFGASRSPAGEAAYRWLAGIAQGNREIIRSW
jgi:hypothetical protein